MRSECEAVVKQRSGSTSFKGARSGSIGLTVKYERRFATSPSEFTSARQWNYADTINWPLMFIASLKEEST